MDATAARCDGHNELGRGALLRFAAVAARQFAPLRKAPRPSEGRLPSPRSPPFGGNLEKIGVFLFNADHVFQLDADYDTTSPPANPGA